MLDSEWIMEILCRKGLDQTVLGSISELRKKSTGTIQLTLRTCSSAALLTIIDTNNTGNEGTMNCELEKMLMNTADLVSVK